MNLVFDITELWDGAIAIYKYGGEVYGTTKTKLSDSDYILVVDDDSAYDIDYKNEPLKVDNVDYHVYNKSTFYKMLLDNNIVALECLYQLNPIKPYNWGDIPIDFEKLRRGISKIASNSWVKAKKKLTVEKDYNDYIGKKSLFHALRLLVFGIQIAEEGRIYNYSKANWYWNLIVLEETKDWEYYKYMYQDTYNMLCSHFRQVCPIDKNKKDDF